MTDSIWRIFFTNISERVIYARRPDGGKNPELGYTIDEGEPIDVETACVSCIELKIRNSKFGIWNSNFETRIILEWEFEIWNLKIKKSCEYVIFFRILKKYVGVEPIDQSKKIGQNKEYISIRLKNCFPMVWKLKKMRPKLYWCVYKLTCWNHYFLPKMKKKTKGTIFLFLLKWEKKPFHKYCNFDGKKHDFIIVILCLFFSQVKPKMKKKIKGTSNQQ